MAHFFPSRLHGLWWSFYWARKDDSWHFSAHFIPQLTCKLSIRIQLSFIIALNIFNKFSRNWKHQKSNLIAHTLFYFHSAIVTHWFLFGRLLARHGHPILFPYVNIFNFALKMPNENQKIISHLVVVKLEMRITHNPSIHQILILISNMNCNKCFTR